MSKTQRWSSPPSPWARLVSDLRANGMTLEAIGGAMGLPYPKQRASDIEKGRTLDVGFESALKLIALHRTVVCKPPESVG
jgi:hypothetical protein